MAERIIQADDAELCTESSGDPSASRALLIAGIGSSMLWWEAGFCRLLAGRDRFVLRQLATAGNRTRSADQDTGADATRLVEREKVGDAAPGRDADELGDRLRWCGPAGVAVLVAPPTDESMRFVSTAEVEWSSKRSVVEYMRVLAGADPTVRGVRRSRLRLSRCRARARHRGDLEPRLACRGDRQRAPLGSIEAPVLAVHGTADPMFPLAHGEALADEIPGARLLTLSGAGHRVYREDRDTLAGAIAEHTAG